VSVQGGHLAVDSLYHTLVVVAEEGNPVLAGHSLLAGAVPRIVVPVGDNRPAEVELHIAVVADRIDLEVHLQISHLCDRKSRQWLQEGV